MQTESKTCRSLAEMALSAVRKNPQEPAQTRGSRQKKANRLGLAFKVLVVAADLGSIPCKCRPAKPYLTHPSPADSCGSLELFGAHPHLSVGFRIRSSHHFESSSSKVAPLPVAKSPMRTLPSVLVEPPILVNKLPSLPTTVDPVLV